MAFLIVSKNYKPTDTEPPINPILIQEYNENEPEEIIEEISDVRQTKELNRIKHWSDY